MRQSAALEGRVLRHQARHALVRSQRHRHELARVADRSQQLAVVEGFAEEAQRRAHGTIHRIAPRHGPALGDLPRRLAVGFFHHRFGHCDQQRRLARKILVDRADRNAGALGDALDRDLRHGLRLELAARRIEDSPDPLASARLLGDAPPRALRFRRTHLFDPPLGRT